MQDKICAIQCDCVILPSSLEGCMTKIIEELQARVAESKKHLDQVTQTFLTAQQAYQLATQDHNIWNLALQAEIRAEQRRAAAAIEKQLPLPNARAEDKTESPTN